MGSPEDAVSLPYTATKYAVQAGKNLLAKPPKPPKPAAAPSAEETQDDIAKASRLARDRVRERAAATTANRVTGPSGLTGKATTAPKTLLGGAV